MWSWGIKFGMAPESFLYFRCMSVLGLLGFLRLLEGLSECFWGFRNPFVLGLGNICLQLCLELTDLVSVGLGGLLTCVPCFMLLKKDGGVETIPSITKGFIRFYTKSLVFGVRSWSSVVEGVWGLGA